MRVRIHIIALLSLGWLYSPVVVAATYLELSSGLIFIDTPADISRPTLLDLRLGYAKPGYQVELALMTSIKEGEVNQLAVDVPSIVSVFYHYVPDTPSSLKLHYILGASRIDVESTYPGLAGSESNFYGLSYGIGFEEHFKSMPQLKLSLDLLQLYLGDEVDIYAASLGVHYEF